MKKEQFKDVALSIIEKELSKVVDHAGHIGNIYEVKNPEFGVIKFKYKNPNDGSENTGKIMFQFYN